MRLPLFSPPREAHALSFSEFVHQESWESVKLTHLARDAVGAALLLFCRNIDAQIGISWTFRRCRGRKIRRVTSRIEAKKELFGFSSKLLASTAIVPPESVP